VELFHGAPALSHTGYVPRPPLWAGALAQQRLAIFARRV
jgi:hypothetical protein